MQSVLWLLSCFGKKALRGEWKAFKKVRGKWLFIHYSMYVCMYVPLNHRELGRPRLQCRQGECSRERYSTKIWVKCCEAVAVDWE